MQVALLCVQENPADRPSVLEVDSMIKNETAAIATPRRPAFAAKRDEVEADGKSASGHEIGSVNVTTISQVLPRWELQYWGRKVLSLSGSVNPNRGIYVNHVQITTIMNTKF